MNQTANRRGYALNQGVLETLVISLAVVVRDELPEGSSEMPFANGNQTVQTRRHRACPLDDGRREDTAYDP